MAIDGPTDNIGRCQLQGAGLHGALALRCYDFIVVFRRFYSLRRSPLYKLKKIPAPHSAAKIKKDTFALFRNNA